MALLDYSYLGDDEDEHAKVAFFMTLFNQLRTRRVNFEQQWEESAALVWPEYVSSFTYGREISPGSKRTQFQLDNSASVANHRFQAIVEWLITPANLMWSKIKANDPYVMKQKGVTEYFSRVSECLWRERYKDTANFASQNSQNIAGLGAFGSLNMFIDELDDYLDPDERGLRYLGLPVGEIYLIRDHQRRVVGYARHFRLTAQQAKTKWPKKSVPVIEAALAMSSQTLFDFIQFVRPRTDYNPFAPLAPQGKKFASTTIAVQCMCIMEEGGFRRTLPLAHGDYILAPEEDYGRGPTQMVLATLKTSNALWRVFMKATHRKGDPAFLVMDTGLIDLKLHNGAINSGGMSPDGKPLVGVVPGGDVQITEELINRFKEILGDAYLTNLFQLVLGDQKADLGPRQVLEYINERGIILAPTVGGLCPTYLGGMIDRELDLLAWQKKLPAQPQVLREAAGDYKTVFTNPIARAMQAQEGAGFVRSMEFGQAVAQATGDPSIMDVYDFEVAIPEMGENDNAPYHWYASPEKLEQKRKARSQAQERETQSKELPGKAAIMKAQAIAAKAQTGGNIGGTLSGVPQGQMPQMPGQ